MTERIWEIVKTDKGAIVVPKQCLRCPICGSPLLLHDFSAVRGVQSPHGGKVFHHVDIHMKCPKCSFYLTFGVPISEQEFRELASSPLNARILIDELIELQEWIAEALCGENLSELIGERLKRWGYW